MFKASVTIRALEKSLGVTDKALLWFGSEGHMSPVDQ